MSVKAGIKKLSVGIVSAVIIGAVSVPSVSAHVTVKPGEVASASYQTFTVSVPNEKDIPTTSVKVVVPENIASVTPTQKAGWKIEIEKNADASKVTAITWLNGAIPAEQRDEFTFSAKTPDTSGEVQWKAYQTYSDGVVVAWDQAQTEGSGHDSNEPNKGPFSVTKVTGDIEEDENKSAAIADAEATANRAQYIAIGATLIALVAVFLATRKK